MRRLLALGLALGASGCLLPATPNQPNQGTIVQATDDPFEWRSAQPRDVRGGAQGAAARLPETQGTACRTVLAWPPNPPTPFLGSATAAQLIPWPSFGVAFGNEGFAMAARQAEDAAGGGTLVDVRADLHTTSVLGIWRRECVEVHALVARGPR